MNMPVNPYNKPMRPMRQDRRNPPLAPDQVTPLPGPDGVVRGGGGISDPFMPRPIGGTVYNPKPAMPRPIGGGISDPVIQPMSGGNVVRTSNPFTNDAKPNPGLPMFKKGGAVKDTSAKYMSFSKTGKPAGMKKVTKMASGGTASSRGDGIAQRGKTRGKMC